MALKKRYSSIILIILSIINLLCGCADQSSPEKGSPTEASVISTSVPVIDAKASISGTAFVSAMEKHGYEWRGEEIYGTGKYSDDIYKITEIRNYTLCIADDNEIYSDVMAIQYNKCVDSAGAINVFNELRSYGSFILSEDSGDNYTRIEFNGVDGWEYGIICIVDNTIITILADKDYQNTAEQLMTNLGY